MHRFHIPDMSCGGCVGAVTRTVQKVDPDARVDADLETKVVTITSAEPEAPLLAALAKAGYPANPQPGMR